MDRRISTLAQLREILRPVFLITRRPTPDAARAHAIESWIDMMTATDPAPAEKPVADPKERAAEIMNLARLGRGEAEPKVVSLRREDGKTIR